MLGWLLRSSSLSLREYSSYLRRKAVADVRYRHGSPAVMDTNGDEKAPEKMIRSLLGL